MPRVRFQLKEIKDRRQLASKLGGIDVKALDLVELSQDVCKSEDCDLLAAERNFGNCIQCRQSWFPRFLNNSGLKSAICRGHGL